MAKNSPVINVEKAEDSGARGVKDESFSPPDGGLLAWVVVIASFLTNGIIFGIHNCYGILYVQLKKQLEQNGIEGAATKACEKEKAKWTYILNVTINIRYYASFGWVFINRNDFPNFTPCRNNDRFCWIETDSNAWWRNSDDWHARVLFRNGSRI